MTQESDPLPTPPTPGGAPAPAPAPATLTVNADLSRLELVLAQVTGELVRGRRNERRWRLAGRVAWFLLALSIVWGLASSQRGKVTTPSGPHTALVDVRGEIASQGEASAENIVSALRRAF
jgi:protease IV